MGGAKQGMSIHSQLREGTRAGHDRMEALPILRQVVTGTVTRPAYEAVLAAFLGFVGPLEPQLEPQLGDVPWLRRTPHLKADLAALGWPAARIAGVAPCPRLPAVDSPAVAFGVCYVMEGSTLGGAVLSHGLRYHPDAGVRHARAYFGARGADANLAWQHFMKVLEARFTRPPLDTPAATETAVAAARETFDCLHHWLDGLGATDPCPPQPARSQKGRGTEPWFRPSH